MCMFKMSFLFKVISGYICIFKDFVYLYFYFILFNALHDTKSEIETQSVNLGIPTDVKSCPFCCYIKCAISKVTGGGM